MCNYFTFDIQRLSSVEAGNIEQLPIDEDEDDNFGLDIKMDKLLREELNGGDETDKVRLPLFSKLQGDT